MEVATFVVGWLVGIVTTEIAVVVTMRCEEKKAANEEFVKKIIAEKGWTEARWELETAFRGKYMRTWRKLYKAYIEKGE